MGAKLTQQVARLSYTRRDTALMDAEVDKYLPTFIPTIKNTGKANVGRLLLRLLMGIVDKLGYSVDMRARQGYLTSVTELQAAIDLVELVRYKKSGVASATADLSLATLTGPAPVGGISIPQYTQFATRTAPVKLFLALEAGTILEGSLVGSIAVVQGVRVVDQVIKTAAKGEPNEKVAMPVAKTPADYIEIKVNGTTYIQKEDFRQSRPEDLHYAVVEDEAGLSTIVFGDGTYGASLQPGVQITATYVQSLGEDGNTPNETITRVIGSLASQISCTNVEVASGGFDGDTVDDIKRKAPLKATSFEVASNNETYQALAESRIAGVYKALAEDNDGPVVNLYILPTGGGVASTALLNSVNSYFLRNQIHGSTLNALPLSSAHILINCNVVLFSSKQNKSVVRKTLFEAISAFKLNGKVNPNGLLYYRNNNVARGFALSDIAALLESLEDGQLVDFVDFVKFTRYPTPSASRDAAPKFVGEIIPNAVADYDSWSLQAVSTTEFYLYKNGVLDSVGNIATTHTSADGSITFTLGTVSDVFVNGDTWTFETSAYKNNIRIASKEFMELARDSDLNFTIYYPNEYKIGQK